MPMTRRMVWAAVAAGVSVVSGPASAAPHLVGFVVYRADGLGNALNSPPYFYTTNLSINAARQVLTPEGGAPQSVSISIPLLEGANTIGFTTGFSVNPGGHVGVQLYFNDSGGVFNPAFAGVQADLAAYVPTGTSLLTAVDAGRSLIDYGDSYGALVGYGGAVSFQVGDQIITISNLEIDAIPSGSITLDVATIPAPAAFGAFAVAGLGGLMGGRRRR
jgi:hypothetical protein